MTKQETFDIVAKHLLTQNRKSSVPSRVTDDTDSCLYRHPCGLKCAVGVLIPDDRYTKDFEGLGVVSPEFADYKVGPSPVGLLMVELGHDLELCRELQDIHDCIPVDQWRFKLEELAKKEGLTFNG